MMLLITVHGCGHVRHFHDASYESYVCGVCDVCDVKCPRYCNNVVNDCDVSNVCDVFAVCDICTGCGVVISLIMCWL